jgi:hypothetical protein
LDRLARVVCKVRATKLAAIKEVDVRARAVAEAARTRALVLVRRERRAAHACHRVAVRIGAEIVRLGTLLRSIHIDARVAHVIAVRRRAQIAAGAIRIRLAAVRVVHDDAARAVAVHVNVFAHGVMTRAAGIVAMRRAARSAA